MMAGRRIATLSLIALGIALRSWRDRAGILFAEFSDNSPMV